MLMKRAALVAVLILVGFATTAISIYALAFSGESSSEPAFSGPWIARHLPILIGMVILVVGFRMLGTTRTRQVDPDADDPAP